MSAIRRAGGLLLRRLGVRSLLALRSGGCLAEDGWFRSFDAGRPMDLAGNPLPWLTYPVIDFLSRRLRPDMTVFEYGSGWGTLWWASQVSFVVACEHDARWHREMTPRMPPNVELIHVPLERNGAYARTAAGRKERFDIIVVDGRDRVRCALQSVSVLKPSGVFVWDNTDRLHYASGLKDLESQGFRRIDFVGLVPGNVTKVRTSVLYRVENCLGI